MRHEFQIFHTLEDRQIIEESLQQSGDVFFSASKHFIGSKERAVRHYVRLTERDVEMPEGRMICYLRDGQKKAYAWGRSLDDVFHCTGGAWLPIRGSKIYTFFPSWWDCLFDHIKDWGWPKFEMEFAKGQSLEACLRKTLPKLKRKDYSIEEYNSHFNLLKVKV